MASNESSRSLHALLSEVDSHLSLSPSVENFLLELSEDFIDSISSLASKVSCHRGSSTIDFQDIQNVLEKQYNMYIPNEETRKKSIKMTHPSTLIPTSSSNMATTRHLVRLERKKQSTVIIKKQKVENVKSSKKKKKKDN